MYLIQKKVRNEQEGSEKRKMKTKVKINENLLKRKIQSVSVA